MPCISGKIAQRATVLLCLVVVLAQVQVKAQSVRKSRMDGVVWSTVNFHWLMSAKNQVFLNNNFRLRNTNSGTELFRFQHELGITHHVNLHWHFGATAKYVQEDDLGSQGFFKGFLFHQGFMGSLEFTKMIIGEYLLRPEERSNQIINDLGRLSFQLGLHRDFEILGRTLFVDVSERAFLIYDLEDWPGEVYENRFFDKTRLRLDLGIYLGPVDYPHRWRLVMYQMRETNYFYSTIDDELINLITPTFGVEIHYRFGTIEP